MLSKKGDEKMKIHKAYKFRLYPNVEQQVMIAKTFGCARFIYNKMLEMKIACYKENKQILNITPASLKKDFEWLKEVDSLALCNSQMQLTKAYNNFFHNESAGFPKFKSKRNSRQSYTTNNQKGTIRIENERIKLPKIGFVRIKQHRQIQQDYLIKNVTVSQEPSGKYFVSILTEHDVDFKKHELNINNSIGLDYSSTNFYVDSNGNKANMPYFYRNFEKRLSIENKKFSKMVKGSNNYKKQKIKIARIHEKIRNCRKDWQHKESTKLVKNYDFIFVEDISCDEIAHNFKLAKATYDNAFSQFRIFLNYKMMTSGKILITINKWFPSSQICHFCNYVNSDLKLSQKEWDCPCCGKHILRDYNAAINIKNEGIRMVT